MDDDMYTAHAAAGEEWLASGRGKRSPSDASRPVAQSLVLLCRIPFSSIIQRFSGEGMLRDDDAWAIATKTLGDWNFCWVFSFKFKLFGTSRNSIAPTCTWLEYQTIGHEARYAKAMGEVLRLWHALASCPGFSASENPTFWLRVIHRVYGDRRDHIERPFFFYPDANAHPFPSLRLIVDEVESSYALRTSACTEQLLSHLFGIHVPGRVVPPSPALLAALARLQPYVDMDRFSRPIPVQLVYQLPHKFRDQKATRVDFSSYITRMHAILLAAQALPAPDHAAVLARPRYTVQSIRLVGIYNLSDAMYSELTSLMDDPRLRGLTFPRVGIAKIQRASLETFDRFLQYVLRPSTGDLLPKPRLPQTLTLQCSQTAMTIGHLGTFFQLLPFTQAIRSLTLNGMGNNWQLWAWLGFALFHPNASLSSLRKLSFLRHTTCLDVGTLWLFVEAATLRLSSADEFAYVVESYAQEHPVRYTQVIQGVFNHRSPGCEAHFARTWPTDYKINEAARVYRRYDVASTMEVLESTLASRPTVSSTAITSVAIDLSFHTQAHRPAGLPCYFEQEFDMTAWMLVLATLSSALKRIYVTPLYCHRYVFPKIRLALSLDAVVMLVRRCPQLVSLSIPIHTCTEAQLTELLEATRATLRSFEVHAPADVIHQVLQVLVRAAQSNSQYALRHVSFAVRNGHLERNGESWRLIDELLVRGSRSQFCLEYLYVHMEKLEFQPNWLGVGDPIGEATRELKRFHGEVLLHARAAEMSRQAVALLSVVILRPSAACGSLDAVLVATIVAFVRPLVRRHVGIDWFTINSLHSMDDALDTFGTDPERDPGHLLNRP